MVYVKVSLLQLVVHRVLREGTSTFFGDSGNVQCELSPTADTMPAGACTSSIAGGRPLLNKDESMEDHIL